MLLLLLLLPLSAVLLWPRRLQGIHRQDSFRPLDQIQPGNLVVPSVCPTPSNSHCMSAWGCGPGTVGGLVWWCCLPVCVEATGWWPCPGATGSPASPVCCWVSHDGGTTGAGCVFKQQWQSLPRWCRCHVLCGCHMDSIPCSLLSDTVWLTSCWQCCLQAGVRWVEAPVFLLWYDGVMWLVPACLTKEMCGACFMWCDGWVIPACDCGGCRGLLATVIVVRVKRLSVRVQLDRLSLYCNNSSFWELHPGWHAHVCWNDSQPARAWLPGTMPSPWR